MSKKNEKILAEQKIAMAEAQKKINECKKTHSKTLQIGLNYCLTVFPEEIRQLTWLTSLSVVGTEFKILPDWIGELENLRVLDISGNLKIRKLPSTISKLKKLKKIVLDHTGLKKIPLIISNLLSLELLDICIYDLKEIPQCVLDLPKLKRIETKGINICHLPLLAAKQQELDRKECLRRIEYCKKQKKKNINLFDLHICELPKELSDLYWLEKLNLCCCHLKKLPNWIGNFSKLTELDLSHNELKSLPDTIGNLSKLKKINLAGNRLQTLPETFGNLTSLEEFYPASCLTSLPESFGNLSSLKTFYVSNTSLKRLPESFGNLRSLRELFIDKFLEEEFHFPKSMKNLKALRKLDLSAFDKVPDFVGELKDLTILDISHNMLYTLPDFIENLTKLKTLNLHSTWIKELPEWIGDLKNLVDLDISSNDIIVDPEIVKKLPKLKYFYDGYNIYNTENNENDKSISKLSNKKLKAYSIIANDSILMYEAMFDKSDENLIALANELADETEKRRKKQSDKRLLIKLESDYNE
jgi:Leucine-rich repeat (LRR) protein